jgi:hypothetical protein
VVKGCIVFDFMPFLCKYDKYKIMRSSDNERVVDCDCDVLIRTFPDHIEYYDKEQSIWKQMYPAFRLYRTDATTITLFGNDGRVLSIQAGCSVSIDGVVNSDFDQIINALNVVINFFFNVIAFFGGPTVDRPTEPILYQIYMDTTLGYPVVWNGTDWVNFSGAIA